MNRILLMTALVITFCALTIISHQARADDRLTTLLDEAPVSSMPPIYPTEEQQIGQLWGTREILHCPNGTKLALEDKTSPVCVPMTLEELNGHLGGTL